MSKARILSRLLMLLGAVVAISGTARADAIDGRWCHQDGRRLAIRGPEITTPGGNRIAGDYSRHYFTYVVPGSEPSAGETVHMRLLSEYLMHSRTGTASEEQVWNRCPPDISRRDDRATPAG